ncbi:hypothetical protein ACIBKX_18285 [Streptomyces sp. NPDC050658]|uniref:hypothetical protein n=1 Tax=unclassified Streptomyces TaxID=2593676 RepID=UPI0034206AC5
MSGSFARRRAVRWAGVGGALLLALAGTTAAAVADPASADPTTTAKKTETVSTAELDPGNGLSAHNYRLRMDGAPVEYLTEVSGIDTDNHSVTLMRGSTRSAAVDRWIEDAIAGREGRLKDITVEMLDPMENVVKKYHFGGAFVERVESPATPGPDTLTVRYFTSSIE